MTPKLDIALSTVAVGADRVERLFVEISAAIETGRAHSALRLADVVRRMVPDSMDARLVYARLLARCGDQAAALSALDAFNSVEVRAARVDLLSQLGQIDEARRIAIDLLDHSAVDQIEGFAAALEILCRASAGVHSGWVGLDSSLHLVGQARGGAVLQIDFREGSERCVVPGPSGAALQPFRYLVDSRHGGPLRVVCDGEGLLGVPVSWPPDFAA